MTNEQLETIFDHEVFQAARETNAGDEAIYKNSKHVVIDVCGDYVTLDGVFTDGVTVKKHEVTFIPSIEQLREMTEPRLDWRTFDNKCWKVGDDYYRGTQEGYYMTADYWERFHIAVPKLLAGAMVVMAQRGFKWEGFEKGWVLE